MRRYYEGESPWGELDSGRLLLRGGLMAPNQTILRLII